MKKKSVSLVITSCDRFDLLKKTLSSFFSMNTYPLNQIIIIEDSGEEEKLRRVLDSFPQHEFEVIVNRTRIGQLKSIDKAYKQVRSQYIFHCEDDWEFVAPGFIEKSMRILDEQHWILSVWLRGVGEFPDLDFSDEIFLDESDCGYKLVSGAVFSFNPGLRRLADYEEISEYSRFQSSKFELDISRYYADKGYKSAVLMKPYVRHLGWHRRVLNANKKRYELTYKIDGMFKKLKSGIYKKLSIGRFSG